MKRTLLLLACLTGIALFSDAQTSNPPTTNSPATNSRTTDTIADPGYTASPTKTPVSPTQRAAHQLAALQKKLNLNQDQVINLRMVLLNLNVSLDSLRSNPSGDKKADNQARRAITQDADGKIYAVLTTDQQVAYAKWKQELQMQRQLHRAANQHSVDSTSQQH